MQFPELIESAARKCWPFSTIRAKRTKRTSKSIHRRATGNGSSLPDAKGISFGPGPDNQLTVELAPWSSLVLRNPQPIEAGTEPLGELHFEANRNGEIDERWEIKAESTSDKVISVAFGVRVKGETNYKFLGTADSPPYRVLPTWDEVPNAPDLEFKAVARDLFGAEISRLRTSNGIGVQRSGRESRQPRMS